MVHGPGPYFDGPGPWSTEGVHGPGVHVLYFSGTQSVHELFFVIGAFVELFYCFTVMICSSFFGCDVQQEKNWEFMNVHTMLHR